MGIRIKFSFPFGDHYCCKTIAQYIDRSTSHIHIISFIVRRNYMPRPPIDNGTILITGASSGIGLELAKQFAQRARTMILVARRLQLLEKLSTELQASRKELEVHIEACDLN